MKFCYYLAAIGTGDLNVKLEILEANLKYIHQQVGSFDIIVNCYNSLQDVTKLLDQLEFLDNIHIHHRAGVLVELWFTNPHHYRLEQYDYIMFMLDDIRLLNLDIQHMIQLKNDHQLNFISPRVRGSTHKYFMDQDKGKTLALTNVVEVYCMLLTPHDFYRYMAINNFDNRWIWGVDFMFGYFGIKSGIYYDYDVQHVLESKANVGEAYNSMVKYLRQYGFNNIKEVSQIYPEIIREIKITHDILVIGNGPSVGDYDFGDYIDSFPDVVRMNSFVTDGFEDKIGSRTTIYACADFDIKFDQSLYDSVHTVLFSHTHKPRKTGYEDKEKTIEIYDKTCERLEKEFGFNHFGKAPWPSTGVIVLMYLLMTREGPIYIHGFDGLVHGERLHYFSTEYHGNGSCHKSELEKAFLQYWIDADRLIPLVDYVSSFE